MTQEHLEIERLKAELASLREQKERTDEIVMTLADQNWDYLLQRSRKVKDT